jgi:protein-disulfide isomerase
MMDGTDQTRLVRRRGLLGFLPLILGIWLPACSAAAGDSAAKDSSNQVLARIGTQQVTEADLIATSADYRQQKHDLEEKAIKQYLEDHLLTMEAAAQKVTKDQLLDQIKPADVTDADVDKFYEENKARIPRPKEQIAAQLKQYLAGQKQAEAREKYIDTLAAKYKADVLLEPVRFTLATAGFPTKGGQTAPVTIVEFSDFQCPFCSRLNPTLDQVMSTYGPKVRLVFREFPLAIHNNAAKAAEAALCAKEQGKFWEMHDAMFKDQAGLAVDGLKAKAASIGLDATKFNACLDSGKEADAVKADIQAGSDVGVNGTPAIFINGRMLSGAVPFATVAPVIDDELKRKGQGS